MATQQTEDIGDEARAARGQREPRLGTLVPAGSKVAIAYHFFAHYRGGIVEELIKNGRYHFLFYGDDRDPFRAGIKPHAFSDPQRLVKKRSTQIKGPWLWQAGLLRLAVQRDVPCIILLGSPWFISSWLAAPLARLFGKRVLYWTQGWYTNDTGLRMHLKNLYFRFAHGVIVYEHMSKCLGIQHGFDPDRLYVIHNSLDYHKQVEARNAVTPEMIAARRREYFGDSDAPVALYVGRMIPSKKLHLFFEAAQMLKKRQHPLNLLLVGDGPDRPELERIARESGLNAHFYGACYDERELALLIMSGDVMVSPGNVGLNAIHSLTYGTPVITHDSWDDQGPEVEAIAPGLTGELYKEGDAEDLARAIAVWTTTKLSESQRASAQKLVARFYNPSFQRRVMERAVSGLPANDLFWLEEDPPAHSTNQGVS